MVDSITAFLVRFFATVSAIDIGLAAAVVAAVAAAYQIRQSRRTSQRQAAFDHLRRISGYVHKIVRWPDVHRIQQEILQFYDGGADPLSDEAGEYMTLLSELDLLAFSSERRAADRKIERAYTRSLFHQNVVTPAFIREYHRCCGNELPYRHLLARLDQTLFRAEHPRLALIPFGRRLHDRVGGQDGARWQERSAAKDTASREASTQQVPASGGNEGTATQGEFPSAEA